MTTAMNGNFTATVTALATVVEIECRRQSRMFITFTVGASLLTDFNFEARANSGGDWALIGSVAADYTSPEGPILGASGDLTIAAASGAVHWLRLDVEGFEAIRIQASGTASEIAGHWGAN